MIKNKQFIVGVPDSKMKCELDIIATDEGEAVAIAVGYHLATKKTPVIYMQSDGFSNAINAFTTLIIPYQIPYHLWISKRVDTPQHEVMGNKLEELLELFNIKATIL